MTNGCKEEEVFSWLPAEKVGHFVLWCSWEPSANFFHTMDHSPSVWFPESPGMQGEMGCKPDSETWDVEGVEGRCDRKNWGREALPCKTNAKLDAPAISEANWEALYRFFSSKAQTRTQPFISRCEIELTHMQPQHFWKMCSTSLCLPLLQ